MRRFLVGLLLAGAAGGGVMMSGVVAASATGPTTQCDTTLPGTPVGDTSVLAPGGANTSGEIQVCESNSPVVDGTVTANGNANPPGGYLVANGDPGSNATGYIGVEGGTGGVDVVGCATGDYNNGTNSNTDGTNGASAPGPNDGATDANGNNVIVASNGQNTLPDTASGGPCSLDNEPTP
jgi:hypothetical protein